MTERISHEEALRCVGRFPDDYDVDLLSAYIRQQQALEANTVSRAEHEAVRLELAREIAAHIADSSALATERVRAEEAEATIQRTQGVHVSWVHQCEKLRAELAAANARAGMLEEAIREALEALSRCYTARVGDVLRATLSTAPQASTEQASLPDYCPACDVMTPTGGSCRSCNGTLIVQPRLDALCACGHRYGAHSCGTKGPCAECSCKAWQASPSPAVGEGSPQTDKHEAPEVYPPADCVLCPTRGVTSLMCPNCRAYVRPHCAKPVNPHVWQSDGTHSVCVRCGIYNFTGNRETGPCPVEPQGRPEQAGEYVTRAELVEVLREFTHVPPFQRLATRLEGK